VGSSGARHSGSGCPQRSSGACCFSRALTPSRRRPRSAPPLRDFVSMPLFWVLMVAMVIGGGGRGGDDGLGSQLRRARARRRAAQRRSHQSRCSARSWPFGRFACAGLVSRVPAVTVMAVSAAAYCAVSLVPGVRKRPVGRVGMFALGGYSFRASGRHFCRWPQSRSQRIPRACFRCLAAAGIVGCAIFPWGMGAISDVSGLRQA